MYKIFLVPDNCCLFFWAARLGSARRGSFWFLCCLFLIFAQSKIAKTKLLPPMATKMFIVVSSRALGWPEQAAWMVREAGTSSLQQQIFGRPPESVVLMALVQQRECHQNNTPTSSRGGGDVVGGCCGVVRASGERMEGLGRPPSWLGLVVVWEVVFYYCCHLFFVGRASEGGRQARRAMFVHVRALLVCIFDLILCTRAIMAHFMCTPVVLQVICLFYFLPFIFVWIENYKFFFFPKMLKKSQIIAKNEISIKPERYVFAIDFWRARGFVGIYWAYFGPQSKKSVGTGPFLDSGQPLHHFIGIKCINEDTTINQWK